jgi:hypothetical protein
MAQIQITLDIEIDGTLGNNTLENIILEYLCKRMGQVILSEEIDRTDDYAIFIEEVEVKEIYPESNELWPKPFDFG